MKKYRIANNKGMRLYTIEKNVGDFLFSHWITINADGKDVYGDITNPDTQWIFRSIEEAKDVIIGLLNPPQPTEKEYTYL